MDLQRYVSLHLVSDALTTACCIVAIRVGVSAEAIAKFVQDRTSVAVSIDQKKSVCLCLSLSVRPSVHLS